MEITDTLLGILNILLLFGVAFVNGFTDAPTSITSVVVTKTLSLKKACILCGVLNLSGLAIVSAISTEIADEIGKIGEIHGNQRGACAVLLTVVLFGTVTWRFGMMSSESIALISALSAVSLFYNGCTDTRELWLILLFLIVSCLISFFLAYFISRLFPKNSANYSLPLVLGCCLSSFIHGAQDGLKLTGLAILLFDSADSYPLSKPVIIVAVGSAILIGTLFSGERIIRSIGEKAVKLNTRSAFFSDIASFLSLFLCTLLSIPVSTGNARATSILGAGLGNGERINKKVAIELIATSIATIPVCFVLCYSLCFLLEMI
ncbi:MAG: inorganic phosphate transporter [Clostridia bacterium]|nr:inorganic phosphate transporter [Clostridia bacterium]